MAFLSSSQEESLVSRSAIHTVQSLSGGNVSSVVTNRKKGGRPWKERPPRDRVQLWRQVCCEETPAGYKSASGSFWVMNHHVIRPTSSPFQSWRRARLWPGARGRLPVVVPAVTVKAAGEQAP